MQDVVLNRFKLCEQEIARHAGNFLVELEAANRFDPLLGDESFSAGLRQALNLSRGIFTQVATSLACDAAFDLSQPALNQFDEVSFEIVRASQSLTQEAFQLQQCPESAAFGQMKQEVLPKLLDGVIELSEARATLARNTSYFSFFQNPRSTLLRVCLELQRSTELTEVGLTIGEVGTLDEVFDLIESRDLGVFMRASGIHKLTLRYPAPFKDMALVLEHSSTDFEITARLFSNKEPLEEVKLREDSPILLSLALSPLAKEDTFKAVDRIFEGDGRSGIENFIKVWRSTNDGAELMGTAFQLLYGLGYRLRCSQPAPHYVICDPNAFSRAGMIISAVKFFASNDYVTVDFGAKGGNSEIAERLGCKRYGAMSSEQFNQIYPNGITGFSSKEFPNHMTKKGKPGIPMEFHSICEYLQKAGFSFNAETSTWS